MVFNVCGVILNAGSVWGEIEEARVKRDAGMGHESMSECHSSCNLIQRALLKQLTSDMLLQVWHNVY